jgi:hypothetical protein
MNMRALCGFALAGIMVAGCRGQHEGPGTIAGKRLPDAVVAARQTREADASRRFAPEPAVSQDTQILFGDLHVHTTFSADAFMRSLPMVQGEGAHPPADACDFARFCSALDFWSINDHAEGISPQHWQETKEAIRQCNAVAGDPRNPDVVAFLGWEWTQVGATAATHYGHKNVIFRDTAEDKVPKRPISALNDQLIGALRRQPPLWQRVQFPLFDWPNRQRYFDFAQFQTELLDTPPCPDGVDTRTLPPNCHERAQTPRELFEKLSQWGFDTIVIPHGTTWGLYTPPGGPSDERRLITRIEIVRIRPQEKPGEPLRQLIDDPWRRFDCPPDQAGCAAEFEDPDFVAGRREFIYYARAIQEPTPAINAGGLRCTYNDKGECVTVHPCYGDYRTPADDDCLSPNEERAWSSPIYVGVTRDT